MDGVDHFQRFMDVVDHFQSPVDERDDLYSVHRVDPFLGRHGWCGLFLVIHTLLRSFLTTWKTPIAQIIFIFPMPLDHVHHQYNPNLLIYMNWDFFKCKSCVSIHLVSYWLELRVMGITQCQGYPSCHGYHSVSGLFVRKTWSFSIMGKLLGGLWELLMRGKITQGIGITQCNNGYHSV
jgi:hypothetical protein